nr:sugar ABC transporter permease [Holtiella tumoricola]
MKQVRLNYDAYLLLAPFGIIFILFTLLPVVIALYYSFTYYNVLEPAQFIGFQNYINLFVNDDVFLIALKNTFIIAAITGLIGYFACFFFAWLINELPPIPRAIMVIIFYAPSISGSAFLIWSIIFSGDAYGYLNAILLNLGLVNAPIKWLTDPQYMLTVVIIVQLWMSLGAGFLSFVAGFKMVDQSQYEAGYIDGIKNRWQELWYITFPSMRPQLMFGAVMTITSSFTVADVTAQLCGSPSTDYAAHTILNHLNDYGGVRFDMGYACAIATILFITMLVLNHIIQKLLHKLGR